MFEIVYLSQQFICDFKNSMGKEKEKLKNESN